MFFIGEPRRIKDWAWVLAHPRPFSIYIMSCDLLYYNDVLLSSGCPPFGRTEPINIEYARHHLDYGVVYIKLHNSPGNEFWSSLEFHGWEKDADSSTISYSREGYRLEYINAEQLIVIEPPLKVTP